MFSDFGHNPVLCDVRHVRITSGMLSCSASEFRSEKAFRVTPAVTKVDSLLRASSKSSQRTRRAFPSSRSNTGAGEIEFKQACQNSWQMGPKNEDITKSMNSFDF